MRVIKLIIKIKVVRIKIKKIILWLKIHLLDNYKGHKNRLNLLKNVQILKKLVYQQYIQDLIELPAIENSNIHNKVQGKY